MYINTVESGRHDSVMIHAVAVGVSVLVLGPLYRGRSRSFGM